MIVPAGTVAGGGRGAGGVPFRVGGSPPLPRGFIHSALQTTMLSERTSFLLSNDFFGAAAYTNPYAALNFASGMNNMFAFGAVPDVAMSDFITSRNAGFSFYMPGASHVVDWDGSANTALEIATQSQDAAGICAATGRDRSMWTLMAEWDQSGGSWVPNGRPRYLGMTRQEAYSEFTNYYLNSPPLGTYLALPPASRGCRFASMTDYPPNAFYAFEMGIDVGVMERGIDDLGDTSTGLAFMRGAGRLYNRPWGIDVSGWRSLAETATDYNSGGTQIGGWSASYLRRHQYIVYMGGAHMLLIEPSNYYLPPSTTTPNPFGQMVQEYGNFTLTRHTDVGTPVVPMALMLDFFNGFDTKHGLYNQYDAVWYQDIDYDSGDYMINNFFKVAYPNHWLHGTTPGAPFSDPAGYQAFLAAGGDPRPYEPMPFTRWGDTMDVTLNTASLLTLNHYRVIVLMGGVVIDATIRPILQSWVQSGGTLVVNASQVTSADESLLGVTLGGSMVSGGNSSWTADATPYTEPAYLYKPVTLGSATVLATTTGSAPLITSNVVGAGRVIFTTPDYLQSTARDQLLLIGVRLFDSLHAQYAPATVSGGAPIEYMFNTSPGRLITTLINNSGSTWNGTIVAPIAGVIACTEYIGDTSQGFTQNGGQVTVTVAVAPYEIGIYAINY